MKTILYSVLISVVLAGCAIGGAESSGPETSQAKVHSANQVVVETTKETEEASAPIAEPVETREIPEAVVSEGDAGPSETPDATKVVDEATASTIDDDLQRGVTLAEQREFRDARVALTSSLNNELSKKDEKRALELLRAINERIFLSADEGGDCKWYTVKRGDTLGKIAKANGTTYEMLQRLNGLKTSRINVGQKLKMFDGTFTLVVRKDRFAMDLLLDGAFIQRYKVGLGVEGCTPLGEFTIKNRIVKPSDGAYKYGDPKHRLGTRWLGLKNDEGYKGYGIHGCRPSENSKLGTECSRGCVRLSNTDVEEIFDIIPVGTTVKIIEK